MKLDEIVDGNIRRHTLNALKLAYVALSRPAHLAVIAIPSIVLLDDNNQYFSQLINTGWVQYGDVSNAIKTH